MPTHTKQERAKRKVKKSNSVAVSDATEVAVKSERNKKVRPEIRQAPVKGSDVLKGMAKHVFGPIEQGFMVAAGGGPLSSGVKKLVERVRKAPLKDVTDVYKFVTSPKDIADAIAMTRKMIKHSAPGSQKGVGRGNKVLRDGLSKDLKVLQTARKDTKIREANKLDVKSFEAKSKLMRRFKGEREPSEPLKFTLGKSRTD